MTIRVNILPDFSLCGGGVPIRVWHQWDHAVWLAPFLHSIICVVGKFLYHQIEIYHYFYIIYMDVP